MAGRMAAVSTFAKALLHPWMATAMKETISTTHGTGGEHFDRAMESITLTEFGPKTFHSTAPHWTATCSTESYSTATPP